MNGLWDSQLECDLRLLDSVHKAPTLELNLLRQSRIYVSAATSSIWLTNSIALNEAEKTPIPCARINRMGRSLDSAPPKETEKRRGIRE